MAPRGTFSYRNLDSTADLNLRFQNLVKKGIYSGGYLTATGGSFTVTLSPYMAMTNEGMMVSDSETTSVTVSGSILQYIVIDATYNPSGNAIINVLAVPQTQYLTYKDKYICVGVVDMSSAGGSFVSSAYFSYATRDQVTPVQDSKFLGYFTTESDRTLAYPSSVPYKQRVGDFSIVGTNAGTLKFGFWAGTSWVDFVNPGSVSSALNDHIANLSVNAKHVSDAEKAALSGTYGTPSGVNKFITESDSRVLTSQERQALANAVGIGGGLGATNPLVAKNTVIAVPRVFQVNVPIAGNTITLSAGVLGIPVFDVYLGKQGIEALTNTSSAKQYFAVEDEYGNGYISTLTGLPVYITDVYNDGGTTLNPDNVCTSEGFYITAGANIQLKLSTNVSASSRVFIRLNLRGDISALTPNWPGSGNTFLPAITAFRYGKQSFISALQSEFASLLVGNAAGSNPNVLISTSSAGSVTSVSQTWRSGITDVAGIVVHTGSAYTGNIDVSGKQFWFKATSGTGEVIADRYGLAVAGTLGIHAPGFAAQLGGFDQYGRVLAGAGTFDNPSIKFVENDRCGIYYIPQYVAPASGYNLNILDGVGVVINSKTALLIGRDSDTSGITDMDCPLILLQSYSSGKVSYTFGINDNTSIGGAVPGTMSFGSWDGNRTNFVNGLTIDFVNQRTTIDLNLKTSAQILAKNSATIVDDEVAPAYSFSGATNTGMFYVDAWSNTTNPNQFLNGIGFSVNGHAALVVTRDSSVGPSTITGTVANPLILNQHSDGTNVFYDFAIADAYEDGEGNGLMRFGYVNYVGVFVPVFAINGEQSNTHQAQVYGDLIVDNRVTIINTSLRNGSLIFTDINQGIQSSGGNLVVGATGDARMEINAGTNAVDIYGDVHVRAISGSSKMLIGGTGITSTLSTHGTRGFVFSYESASTDTRGFSWGFNNTPMGLLAASGKVFSVGTNDVITYGFMDHSGVGIGTNAANALVLYGSSVNTSVLSATTVLAQDGTFIGTLNVNNLNVSGVFGITNISIPGTATIAKAVITDEIVTKLAVGTGRSIQPDQPFVQPDQSILVGAGGIRHNNVDQILLEPGCVSAEVVDTDVIYVKQVFRPKATQRPWYIKPAASSAPIIFWISKTQTPTPNNTTLLAPLTPTFPLEQLGTPTVIILDGNYQDHHIHVVSYSTALPQAQTGTPSGLSGSDIIDYGTNGVLKYDGTVDYVPGLCTAIRLDATDYDNAHVLDAFNIKITASEYLSAYDYVDLIDQTLERTGGTLTGDTRGNRWNSQNRLNVTGYFNPYTTEQWNYVNHDIIAGVNWCKFDRIALVDRLPIGYPAHINGFDLRISRSINGDGISSIGPIGANWNVGVHRFGRR